ncbi:SGNH/GDSL hydrolase family protein [Actinokineospora sp. UTMC 2448]|uniref:SGNH/GDSL hydrolase family protein n=1 Tax=Actinokineospora sp. UTMC 2448 TaxID=2268449 RepID=UPI00216475EF|nr:SGNH/GDSL hydrolase family protein [Actinokineospora sp. UTMC 2448]UVS81661.1 Lipase 2 precursor [Actinokineospora sp. UTMC 2448]
MPRMSRAVLPALLATALLTAPAAADSSYQRYVALGDSFAAVGTLTNIRTDPIGCARATDNYPSGVAARIQPEQFVDVTCGGARIPDLTSPQDVTGGPNPAQFDALTPDTDLVTVSIGGNDVGFGEIISTCARLSLTDPFGAPCKAHYDGELERRIAALGPRITEVVEQIRDRSPRADIVVVGYLRILPPRGGCWPVVPVAYGDVPHFAGIQDLLNATIGRHATAAGAVFVNPGVTTGHDVCQLPHLKWVEGFIPTSLSVPVHPNARGQAHVASITAAAIG